jgi:hypothetical protein
LKCFFVGVELLFYRVGVGKEEGGGVEEGIACVEVL